LGKQAISLNRVSSGVKIERAEDDPSGLCDSERMEVQIRGLQVVSQNAQDGVSMLQTAEGGLSCITDTLQRVRTLIVQSNDGSKTPSDVQNIQAEVDQLMEGISDAVNHTEFNGQNLLKAVNDPESLLMTVGANPGDTVDIPMYNLSTDKLGDGTYSLDDLKIGGSLNITDRANSDKALGVVDKALESVVNVRSEYGSLENRFDVKMQDAVEFADQIQGAQSYLCDADMAVEISNYSTQNIIIQANIAILAQTNKLPQDALNVLQGVKSR
jgi:flagellin